MKCLKCSKEATVKYPNGDLCNDCFIEILTNRIKKDTKNHVQFKKGDKILVFGKLAKIFLEKVVGNIPLEITEADEKYNSDAIKKYFPDFDKVVIPWTADDEAESFYNELTSDESEFNKENNVIVKIFKMILDKELSMAAKILNMNFEIPSRNSDIERIQKKYPGSKFGLVKSAEEFRKALE